MSLSRTAFIDEIDLCGTKDDDDDDDDDAPPALKPAVATEETAAAARAAKAADVGMGARRSRCDTDSKVLVIVRFLFFRCPSSSAATSAVATPLTASLSFQYDVAIPFSASMSVLLSIL